jgi:predicted nucleic acid-binding protein
MTSSIDSNVFVSLWDKDANNLQARDALDHAREVGKVVVAGAVYAEMMGGVGRSAEMLDDLFLRSGIEVDWRMDRQVWTRAGTAYQQYVDRRAKRKGGPPRRMLTDFLIGAHAERYGAAFPALEVTSI